MSSACWTHPALVYTNTYAAPIAEFFPRAPTTAVERKTAEENPNSSPAVPSEAVSFALRGEPPRSATGRARLACTADCNPLGAAGSVMLEVNEGARGATRKEELRARAVSA